MALQGMPHLTYYHSYETLRQYDLNYLDVKFRIWSFLEMFLSALMFDVMVATS